jgi:hypothetical protein
MTVNALQFSVDRGMKPLNIHIERKLSFFHLLFAGAGNNHLEPLRTALREDVTVSVTFETRLIPDGKSHPCPRKDSEKNQQYKSHSAKEESNTRSPLFIRK